MKKYHISFLTANNNQYAGIEPLDDIYDEDSVQGYVEAGTKWEAIDFALDRLGEDLNDANEDYEIDRENQEILIFDEDGHLTAHYYNFRAEEVTEDY